jgi:shikimate kinase
MPLWLVGMMGSGKSAVGALVARELGGGFFDTDDLVAGEARLSVEDVFRVLGEERFRDLEEAQIEKLAPDKSAVVATGGGAVLRGGNRSMMRESGLVVWLRADPLVLSTRIGSVGGRPLLADTQVLDRLSELAEERTPLYGAAAHLVVDTDDKRLGEVVEEVVSLWKGR